MITVDMSRYEGPYVYLVVFDCPDCHKMMVARGGERVPQDEADMRQRNFRVKCECGFDGVLVGTTWKGLVLLDFSQFSQRYATTV